MLADVQGGEVESDHGHDAPHPGQPTVGQQPAVVGVQRSRDHPQIVGQLVGRAVGPSSRRRLVRLGQAPVDHCQPLAVGLARAEGVEPSRDVGKLLVVDREPPGQLLGDAADRQAHAQLRRQPLDLLHQDAQSPVTLELEHLHGGGRGDVGIAVPVAADP